MTGEVRISQLPVATVPLTGAELVPVVQAGQTTKTPVSQLIYASLGGSSGAANVGFTQPGTGAAVRTVQSKLQDIISSVDYPSTANFSAALSALTANVGAAAYMAPTFTIGVKSSTVPARFFLSYTETLFNSVLDPAAYFGYNSLPNGGLEVAGEPSLCFGIEGRYNDGAKTVMETYLQYRDSSGAGTALRPFMWQINRATNKITGTSFTIGDGGLVFQWDDAATQIANIGRNLIELYPANAANHTVLRLNAAVSNMSAFLMLGYNNVSDVFQIFTAGANQGVLQVNGRGILNLYSSLNGGAGSGLSVGVGDNQAVGTFGVGTSNAAIKGIVSRGTSGQTGNLFEAQDSTSAILSTISENGYYTTRKNSAPADAELSASEVAYWFDPTNGAGKFMIKGKTANGTVVTGSVTLA